MSDIYLHSDLDYSGLLNTHLSPFSYGGKEYRTAEHLFQALKFIDMENADAIRESDNPLTHAYQLEAPPGVRAQRRADWYKVNKVMLKIVLYHKFIQHNDLKQLLLSTGSRKLVNNVADQHWGIGHKRDGGNQFGMVLMEVRRELCNPKSPEVPPLPIYPKPIFLPALPDPDDQGYYYLTNVAPFPVLHSNTVWKSSEHLFHAWKFPLDHDTLLRIFEAEPEEVFRISQNARVRDDWDNIKFDVMTYVVHLKFTSTLASPLKENPSPKERTLLQLLTDTEGTELIWDPDVKSWESGNSGRNVFGKALMRVRDIILYKLQPPMEPPVPPRHY